MDSVWHAFSLDHYSSHIGSGRYQYWHGEDFGTNEHGVSSLRLTRRFHSATRGATWRFAKLVQSSLGPLAMAYWTIAQ